MGGLRRLHRVYAGEEGAAKTSKLILAVTGVFLLVFIAAMTVIFCVKDAVPDTLIQYTLGAGGVEALPLARIKVSKVITQEDDAE